MATVKVYGGGRSLSVDGVSLTMDEQGGYDVPFERADEICIAFGFSREPQAMPEPEPKPEPAKPEEPKVEPTPEPEPVPEPVLIEPPEPMKPVEPHKPKRK